MHRRLLAVIAAVTMATCIILLAVMIGTDWAPHPPKNLEYLSRDEIRAFFPTMPLGGYLTSLSGIILGAFTAGWITAKISKEMRNILLPIVVAVLLILGGALYFVALPGQPAWFIWVTLISFIPVALLGHRTAHIYLHP